MLGPVFIPEEIRRACVELEVRHPGARRLMLTGPMGGEGTTTVTCLFGRMLAEMNGANVVIVDANVRSPGVHEKFSMPLEDGLRDWEPNSPERTVHPCPGCGHLSVMPAGNSNGRSLHTLAQSGQLDQLAAWLTDAFSFVLWDTPPLNLYPEGRFLLRHVDGVLVVVEGDRTTRESLAELCGLVADNGTLLGVIMNRTGRYSIGARPAGNGVQRWRS